MLNYLDLNPGFVLKTKQADLHVSLSSPIFNVYKLHLNLSKPFMKVL